MPDQLRPTRVAFFQSTRHFQTQAFEDVRSEALSGADNERVISFGIDILALPDGKRWLVTAAVVYEALTDGWSE